MVAATFVSAGPAATETPPGIALLTSVSAQDMFDAVDVSPLYVQHMTGVGVEILVEPWELGPRKAKEFLWCAQKLDAETAERFGLVNRVVPRDELDAAVRELAENIALVPPVTAEAIKDVINHMVDGQGQRESWRYHFMVHQFVSNTATALNATEARKQGGMDAVKQEQAGEQRS